MDLKKTSAVAAAGLMGLVLAGDAYAKKESMPSLDSNKIYQVVPFRFQSPGDLGLFVYFSKQKGGTDLEYMGIYQICDPSLKRSVSGGYPRLTFPELKNVLRKKRPFMVVKKDSLDTYIDQNLDGEAEEKVKATKGMKADKYMPGCSK